MDRLESFENMLADLLKQAEHEQTEMEKLKAAGKEKNGNLQTVLIFRKMRIGCTDEDLVCKGCLSLLE